MTVEYDARRGRITITMTPNEFTETVEWLETVDPSDGATNDWRAEHDRVMPHEDEAQ
jgi:hypothetical protein